jgi:uncharacterized protein YkwD
VTTRYGRRASLQDAYCPRPDVLQDPQGSGQTLVRPERLSSRRALLAIIAAVVTVLFHGAVPSEAVALIRRADTVVATEWAVLAEVNRLRRGHGLDPLRMAPPVSEVARDRVVSMRRLDYFAHTSPGGRDAGDLLGSQGVRHRRWGEVIGQTRRMGLGAGGRWMVDWWKRSPVHRELILSSRFEAAGVGIAREGRQTLWTIVFIS